MFITRRRFEEEVNKRVEEQMKQFQDACWRDDRERGQERRMTDIEIRLMQLEKKNGIDHPSHQNYTPAPPICY